MTWIFRGDEPRAATRRHSVETGARRRYAKPFPYVLAHDDFVTCIDFVNFTGQTWVLHEVDETARGLTKDGAFAARIIRGRGRGGAAAATRIFREDERGDADVFRSRPAPLAPRRRARRR